MVPMCIVLFAKANGKKSTSESGAIEEAARQQMSPRREKGSLWMYEWWGERRISSKKCTMM